MLRSRERRWDAVVGLQGQDGGARGGRVAVRVARHGGFLTEFEEGVLEFANRFDVGWEREGRVRDRSTASCPSSWKKAVPVGGAGRAVCAGRGARGQQQYGIRLNGSLILTMLHLRCPLDTQGVVWLQRSGTGREVGLEIEIWGFPVVP